MSKLFFANSALHPSGHCVSLLRSCALPVQRAAVLIGNVASISVLAGLVSVAGATPVPTVGALSGGSIGASGLSPRAFVPRRISSKIDPVEALFHKRDRGTGMEQTIDPVSLPGGIIVKFRDELRVRAPITEGLSLTATTSVDTDFVELLARYGMTARQWIRKPVAVLADIENRARMLSGKEQPDLAGMIYISGGNPADLFEVARTLNALDAVEFVSIERHAVKLQDAPPQGCVPDNPQTCALPACDTPAPPAEGNCNPDPQNAPNWGCNNPACCDAVAQIDPACANGEDPRGWDIYCAAYANLICNPSVYEDPQNGEFDACFYDVFGPDFIDPVFEPVFGRVQLAGCFSSHGGRGCNLPACCDQVCTVDPTCCSEEWDATCANLALSGQFATCPVPSTNDGDTPDFTPVETLNGLEGYQFYLQGGPRGPVQTDRLGLGRVWVGATNGGQTGFSGHGLAIKEFEDFQNLIWEQYQGGSPGQNPFLGGAGIRVGVLETSAFELHEEFILEGPATNPNTPWDGPLLDTPRVIVEEGQELLYIESGLVSVNHGTNVLGTILAGYNGFGVTGVAPRAQGYLFPTVTASSGFRAPEAFATALSEFTPGDVLNFSWGFAGALPYYNSVGNGNWNTPPVVGGVAPIQPVTSDLAFSTLIATASDLLITCVVAAGTGNQPIQGSSEEDVGAILVTGILPGNMLPGTIVGGFCQPNQGLGAEAIVYQRSSGSNFDGEDAQNEDETSDVSAWGFGVITTGATTNYDNETVPNSETFLFRAANDAPPASVGAGLQVDRLREYTQNFGGTSAAAAMISGVVARLQAASKQFFGTPLAPAQIRQIIRTTPNATGQCFSVAPGLGLGGPGFTVDGCIETPDGCQPVNCACEVRPVASPVNLIQLGGTLLGAPVFEGQLSDVDVVTGGQLIGYSWSAFQVAALDGNFLRIAPQRKQIGTIEEGLTYLATGPTTDVRVRREVQFEDPASEVNRLGVRIASRASRNYIFLVAFVLNRVLGRYEFLGADLLTTQTQPLAFELPELGDYSAYIDPTSKEIDIRVWTCGLGLVGRHVVDHDLIEVLVNDPLNPL